MTTLGHMAPSTTKCGTVMAVLTIQVATPTLKVWYSICTLNFVIHTALGIPCSVGNG